MAHQEQKNLQRVVSSGHARPKALSEGFFLSSRDKSFAVSTPRKVGNAPVRSLMRRRVREIYRRHPDRFPSYGAILFLVKREGDFQALRSEMFDLAQTINRRLSEGGR